jgi:dUTP pyrophosphatase
MKVQKLYEDSIIPKRAHITDSGLDVCANNIKKSYINGDVFTPENKLFPYEIHPFERVLVGTGIAATYKVGYEIQVRPRSGLALKKGLSIVNTPGTVDEMYTGEISVILINLSNVSVYIDKDEKIAQLVVCPVVLCNVNEVEKLEETKRNSGGFGSTGK